MWISKSKQKRTELIITELFYLYYSQVHVLHTVTNKQEQWFKLTSNTVYFIQPQTTLDQQLNEAKL